jgi:GTP pyrophosphokinase
MGLDAGTIITALLHDTIEDTDATVKQIEELFGEEIAHLVDGVTKLTKIEFQSESARHAENYRKLFVAMSEDIRVLLVKLADRLHNMRTLYYIKKPEKRKRIAHETMEIYAPLAERIGMQRLKTELQDIAFAELHSEAYQSIYNRMEYLRSNEKIEVKDTIENIEEVLANAGIKCEIQGREKMPYSIWKKMERKNISFEQLTDVIAFRVIVETVADCYAALGAIHQNYHIVPGTFKDFISLPKENGYRSLHTIVIGPNYQRVEIQIRTKEMHAIGEFGVAAHWMYKQHKDKKVNDGIKYRWLRELVSIIEDKASSPEEFLENTRLEMYGDQVFCFTPKGRLYVMPNGATPVDFAFAVHSDIGKTCVGAKVNSKIVPLRTKLRNGDQVEIICSDSAKPSPIWERFVVTGKARAEIKKFTRSQQREEYSNLGKSIIEAICQNEKVAFNEEILDILTSHFNKKDESDLINAVGQGHINQNEIRRALEPEKEKTDKKRLSLLQKLMMRKPAQAEKTAQAEESKISIPIRGLIPGMAVHFAPCCHPLPGERIVGIMSSGKGVIIHTAECIELEHFLDEPERWIDVSWESGTEGQDFIGRLKAILAHKSGSLGTLANVIGNNGGNINNLRITDRHSDYFEIIVDVDVKDIDHLTSIIASLRAEETILSVDRYNEGIAHE